MCKREKAGEQASHVKALGLVTAVNVHSVDTVENLLRTVICISDVQLMLTSLLIPPTPARQPRLTHWCVGQGACRVRTPVDNRPLLPLKDGLVSHCPWKNGQDPAAYATLSGWRPDSYRRTVVDKREFVPRTGSVICPLSTAGERPNRVADVCTT